MSRISTIAIDLLIAEPPPLHWSGLWVRRRLVEAYALERHVPDARRPQSCSWPPYLYEFSDVVGWSDARERVLNSWERRNLTPYEVDRIAEAQAWFALLNDEKYRRCLGAWALARATGQSINRFCRSKNWSRQTFYRYAVNGSILIARNLNMQGIPVS